MPLKNLQALKTKQLSAYESKTTHDIFFMTMEWLEKYIEIAGYYPDWENRKQIKNNNITRKDIIGNPKKAEDSFSTQLALFKDAVEDDPSFLREEVKKEFYRWINATGINNDNSSEKLKHILFGVNEVLEGRGEKIQRDIENRKREIDPNSTEYMEQLSKVFIHIQAPMYDEKETKRSLENKTHKDIEIRNKFGGNSEQGEEIISRIAGQVYDSYQNFHHFSQKEQESRDKEVEMDTDDDFRENFQQSRRNLIENIKQDIKDWRVEDVVTSLDCHWDFKQKKWGKKHGNEVKQTMLIHEKAKKVYNQFGSLAIDPEKMKLKDNFSENEWLEISETRRVFAENQLQLVQRKLSGEIRPGIWESEKGMNEWKNQLENEIKSNWLLTDEQMKNMSESEIRHLVERLNTELKKREMGQSSSNYLVSTEQLKGQANKLGIVLNNYSKNSADNSPKPSSIILPAIGVMGLVSLFGIIAYQVRKNKIKK